MDNAIQLPACHSLHRLKARVLEFIDEAEPIEHPQQLLESLLNCRDCVLRVVQTSTPEVQDEFLDRVYRLCRLDLNASTIRHLQTLGTICSSIDRPPPSIVISDGLELGGNDTPATATGGLTDVLFGEHNLKQVAIKVFRNYTDPTMIKAKKLLWEKAAIWGVLSHPNVIRFRGVNTSIFDQLALVYDRAQYGDITHYLRSHPDAPRPTLLLQAARGLGYLHGLGIPHMNLKGTNVLIDGKGQALLTDYGFASINWGVRVPTIESTVGNPRWLAPEIIRQPSRAEEVIESKAADIFAFAMLAVEVFTGRIPFEGHSNSAVVCKILGGDRPEFPRNALEVGLTVPMRRFIQKCWNADPTKRPTINDVVREWDLIGNNDEHDSTPPPTSTGRPFARTAKKARNFLKRLLRLR